jgi:chaperonin GroES
MNSIRPLGDRVLVRRETAENTSPGGIVIPGNVQEKKTIGVVVAVGPGKKSGEGREAMDVKIDDRVMFGKYTGTDIEMNGDKLLLMNEGDILAVIDG